MRIEMDNSDEYDESKIAKPNRRKRLKQKTHTTILGPQPPTGLHKLNRKIAERLTKERIEKFMK